MPFTYMGTKKQIVSNVTSVIEGAKRGPFLDLFAGISTVATAVAPSRQIWCNDVERFAFTLASAKFTSRSGPHLDLEVLGHLLEYANVNRSKLLKLLGQWVLEEEELLHAGAIRRIKQFSKRQIEFATARSTEKQRALHRLLPGKVPYCLFSITYAGSYIGARQAVEVDSLRFAFDALRDAKKIGLDQHRWFVLALCKAMFALSNTTGHFAQYLDVKSSTLNRFLLNRRRDVFSQWVSALKDLDTCGTQEWRLSNKTFQGDANHLLPRLKRFKTVPSVIYADPPYTADQYSRYYHLLETLIVYDYPTIAGKGLYRPGRFVSDFSLRSKVSTAFETLVSSAAALGSDLIINYPEYGLLENTKKSMLTILRSHFSRAELATVIAHEHSSLGASKGVERSPVREMIFYAH